VAQRADDPACSLVATRSVRVHRHGRPESVKNW
jgi:hypothetical protein